MRMSVFQTVLLASFGALAISGLLIFALFVGGGNSNAIGPVTIWGTFDRSSFDAVLDSSIYSKQLTDVTYIQKDSATFGQELTNALAGGTGPDLFFLRQDDSVRDANKILSIPYTYLSHSQFEDTFVEAAQPYLGTDGVLGIPVLIDPMVMYWNRDLLSVAGIAQPPQYWGELQGMVQRLVKRSDSGAISKAAVSFGEYSNVQHAKDILSLIILQTGGSITRLDVEGNLLPALRAYASGSAQSAESAVRFYTEFADPTKINYSWNRSLPNSRAAFTAGDLAFYFGYASEASAITRANPNLNFGVAPVPQVRDASRARTVAHVYALAVSRLSVNPQGAITAANLIGSDVVGAALSAEFGVPSARRDVLAAGEGVANPLFLRESLIAQSWVDPNPEATNLVFRDMIEGVVSGAVRLSEAIQRADQEIAQIIGR